MPLRLTRPMEGLRLTKAHRYATLWRIERTDGTVLRFTDHDTNLKYTFDLTEETYLAAGGFGSSAREKQAGVQEHNLEIIGIVSSSAITEADLQKGKYLDAKVTEILVDWKFPYAGHFVKSTYWVAGLTRTHETWQAQLAGLPARLRREVGWVHDHSCRHELYDYICRVQKGPLLRSGAVTTVTAGRQKFTSSDLGEAEDWYTYGELRWVTGANADYKSDILKHRAGGIIELALFTPVAITVGDLFEVAPGCDKRWSTCEVKFNNKVNFGGFPHMPGTDRIVRGPL